MTSDFVLRVLYWIHFYDMPAEAALEPGHQVVNHRSVASADWMFIGIEDDYNDGGDNADGDDDVASRDGSA